MLSYPFIEELFTNILKHSMVIQGRFYLCPSWGNEANTNTLGDITKRAGLDDKTQFPAVIMMPPRSEGDYFDSRLIDEYNIQLLFLTKAYATGDGRPKSPDVSGLTSMHTTPQDWHDMKRCAISFLRVLRTLMVDNGLNNYFQLLERTRPIMNTVSDAGTAKLNGISLQFNARIVQPCPILEDYQDINNITWPTEDTHPQHLH